MNTTIVQQIQSEQEHGRSKYGRGPHDFAHDDAHAPEDWIDFIRGHLDRAKFSTPLEYRQHLVKAAGLCVSAIEALDRKHPV